MLWQSGLWRIRSFFYCVTVLFFVIVCSGDELTDDIVEFGGRNGGSKRPTAVIRKQQVVSSSFIIHKTPNDPAPEEWSHKEIEKPKTVTIDAGYLVPVPSTVPQPPPPPPPSPSPLPPSSSKQRPAINSPALTFPVEEPDLEYLPPLPPSPPKAPVAQEKNPSIYFHPPTSSADSKVTPNNFSLFDTVAAVQSTNNAQSVSSSLFDDNVIPPAGVVERIVVNNGKNNQVEKKYYTVPNKPAHNRKPVYDRLDDSLFDLESGYADNPSLTASAPEISSPSHYERPATTKRPKNPSLFDAQNKEEGYQIPAATSSGSFQLSPPSVAFQDALPPAAPIAPPAPPVFIQSDNGDYNQVSLTWAQLNALLSPSTDAAAIISSITGSGNQQFVGGGVRPPTPPAPIGPPAPPVGPPAPPVGPPAPTTIRPPVGGGGLTGLIPGVINGLIPSLIPGLKPITGLLPSILSPAPSIFGGSSLFSQQPSFGSSPYYSPPAASPPDYSATQAFQQQQSAPAAPPTIIIYAPPGQLSDTGTSYGSQPSFSPPASPPANPPSYQQQFPSFSPPASPPANPPSYQQSFSSPSFAPPASPPSYQQQQSFFSIAPANSPAANSPSFSNFGSSNQQLLSPPQPPAPPLLPSPPLPPAPPQTLSYKTPSSPPANPIFNSYGEQIGQSSPPFQQQQQLPSYVLSPASPPASPPTSYSPSLQSPPALQNPVAVSSPSYQLTVLSPPPVVSFEQQSPAIVVQQQQQQQPVFVQQQQPLLVQQRPVLVQNKRPVIVQQRPVLVQQQQPIVLQQQQPTVLVQPQTLSDSTFTSYQPAYQASYQDALQPAFQQTLLQPVTTVLQPVRQVFDPVFRPASQQQFRLPFKSNNKSNKGIKGKEGKGRDKFKGKDKGQSGSQSSPSNSYGAPPSYNYASPSYAPATQPQQDAPQNDAAVSDSVDVLQPQLDIQYQYRYSGPPIMGRGEKAAKKVKKLFYKGAILLGGLGAMTAAPIVPGVIGGKRKRRHVGDLAISPESPLPPSADSAQDSYLPLRQAKSLEMSNASRHLSNDGSLFDALPFQGAPIPKELRKELARYLPSEDALTDAECLQKSFCENLVELDDSPYQDSFLFFYSALSPEADTNPWLQQSLTAARKKKCGEFYCTKKVAEPDPIDDEDDTDVGYVNEALAITNTDAALQQSPETKTP